MTLINCPECNKQISDKAGTCPFCGYPIARGGSTQANAGQVQTIEKTAKPLKLQMLLSTILMLFGCYLSFYGFNMMGRVPNGNVLIIGLIAMVIGLFWLIIIKFDTWWHHG